MQKLLSIVVLVISLTVVTSAIAAKDDGSQIQSDNYYPRVLLETTMGNIVVELDRTRAPITANNFLRYVDKRGFEGTIFHRVIKGFVVQGGGYDKDFKELPRFPDIYNESGNGLKNELYTIAMGRSNDEHSASRHFYFNMDDNESLDPGRKWGYAVFGYVVEGNDVLDAISMVETKDDVRRADVPIEPILLIKASVLPPPSLNKSD